ncbi:MAG TPA: Rrf2 family transcriptional regulator [Phycisphaerales bacterium]|nr:Rrf2 family transcriptional regulator [Phycisphaerales bacterium]
MLKLSTKSSYGLRACLTLARANQRLSSSEIAERDGIPKRYLEQILSALRQSGLVESTRGAQGGYSLSRPPREITIAQLVESVEGELPPILCTNPGLRSDNCRTESECDCRELCHELESSMTRVLGGTTLADILKQSDNTLNNQDTKSLTSTTTGDAHDGGGNRIVSLASSISENNKR